MSLGTFHVYCNSIHGSLTEISSGVLTGELIKTVFKGRDIKKHKTFCDRFSGDKEKYMLF
jgi:hypothetical protein